VPVWLRVATSALLLLVSLKLEFLMVGDVEKVLAPENV